MCPDIPRRALLAGALGVAVAGRPALAAERITVFAAASLKPALDALAADWPAPIALSYGGSGTMARQVAAGAPADVVILAATDWMDWLGDEGVLDGAPRAVAGNALVLAAPLGSGPVALEAEALHDRLGTGRLAMGDPLSVPAGRYAQEALENLGFWQALAPRALLTEDVRAALAYVARGDVPLGLVYASDAAGIAVEVAARIPAAAHAPIVYPGAVVTGARTGARTFLDHVAGSGAFLAAHGFAPPS